MHPLLLGAASFLAGAFAFSKLEDARQEKMAEDLARQNAIDQSAKELIQGRTYAVTLEINPASPSFGGIRDVARAAQLIKATLEAPGGTGGWQLTSAAAPIDEGARRALVAGKPSQWAFTGVWTRPQRFVAQKPDWITMAVPFLVPG